MAEGGPITSRSSNDRETRGLEKSCCRSNDEDHAVQTAARIDAKCEASGDALVRKCYEAPKKQSRRKGEILGGVLDLPLRRLIKSKTDHDLHRPKPRVKQKTAPRTRFALQNCAHSSSLSKTLNISRIWSANPEIDNLLESRLDRVLYAAKRIVGRPWHLDLAVPPNSPRWSGLT
jgi:hypothetical protein